MFSYDNATGKKNNAKFSAKVVADREFENLKIRESVRNRVFAKMNDREYKLFYSTLIVCLYVSNCTGIVGQTFLLSQLATSMEHPPLLSYLQTFQANSQLK